MELSHHLLRSVCAPPHQESYQLQGFSGFCRERQLFLRGLISSSQSRPQLLVSVDAVRVETCGKKKRFWCGATPQACWSGEEDLASSRDGTSACVYCQSSSSQQTLEKPPPRCCSGLKGAARYACNDARIVNQRAREGFILIARGFERLDRRARQDVAILGSEFLKLDARARKDTVKLDTDARKNAALLQSIAVGFTDEASAQLKTAADKHWSDGALDADLRLADLRAKRRAMEDAFLALQLVKSIHNGMAKRAYRRQNEFKGLAIMPQDSILQGVDSSQQNDPTERLAALQDAYWDIASALAEADGIDYSDPEELELLIAALLDMDAVDGASSAIMLAECAKSPDVATRQALANALGNAPSLWALGNAGMGALQRLTKDVNPAVAAAATKALEELKKQWEMDSKESLTFRADGTFLESLYPSEDSEDDK